MHRLWLIFAQTVTVAVAVLFVVGTLKPDWLSGRPAVVALQEAPRPADGEATPSGSFRDAARARVSVAQAQLGEARARIGRLDIRSPAAGLVLTPAAETFAALRRAGRSSPPAGSR